MVNSNRFFLVILVLLFVMAGPTFTQSVGGGISFFVPETLYFDGDGTVAFEQGLSTSIGFGSFLSIPIGFTYHASDGYRLEGTGLNSVVGPTLYGDIIAPYIQAKIRIPLGMLYIDGFAGGMAGYAFSLKPTGNFQKAFGADFVLESYEFNRKFGYGWLAGGALGVRIGAIAVDLGVSYRDLGLPLEGTVTNRGLSAEQLPADAIARLRGLAIRIGGNFSF